MKLKTSYKTFFGLLLGAVVLFFLKNYTIIPVVMLAVGLVSLLVPAIAHAIDWVVSKVIRVIGIFLSAVLLFLSFFFVLTPVALIARLFGKTDSLGLKRPTTTNYKVVNKTFDPGGFEKMW